MYNDFDVTICGCDGSPRCIICNGTNKLIFLNGELRPSNEVELDGGKPDDVKSFTDK
jgi:hypothetical protein